jgi:hypothetical protein
MPLTVTVPLGDGEYRREFDASIDVPALQRARVRGRMRDPRFELEHDWLLSLPDYEVLEAAAAQHRGDPVLVDPALCLRYPAIRGVRIGRGFSRRISAVLGDDWPGAAIHLLLAIEMARVGQQVFQLPLDFDQRFPVEQPGASGAALASWRKDRAYMPALADSCYTYRDDSGALFLERDVVCNFGEEISRPAPGSRTVFQRHKHVRICVDGAGFVCDSGMQDNLHDIAVRLVLDARGRVSAATSRSGRLPYSGLCESPHARMQSLVGLSLTTAFVEQFAERIGGEQGCTHLFDLATDCLRLFRFED